MSAFTDRVRARSAWVGHRRTRLIAAPLLAAAVAVVPAASSLARSPVPGVRLLVAQHHVDVQRYPHDPHLFIPSAVYVASTRGAFELDVSRSNKATSVWQVRRSGGAVDRIRRIHPVGRMHMDRGLPQFFDLTLRDGNGAVVAKQAQAFCPVADYNAARTDPSGPDNPTYPYYCGDKLTRSAVWGIDQGWAESFYSALKASAKTVPDGKYSLRVAINPAYARQLGVPASAAQVDVAVTVSTYAGGSCPPRCAARPAVQRTPTSPRAAANLAARRFNGGTVPPRDGLPDLAALPAHGLTIQHQRKSGRDYLDFAATIWNHGPGPLDVEGFRKGHRPTMVARQFLYVHGRAVSSTVIGTFAFDTRRGHHHWHLEDFARYDLLSATGDQLIRSKKQSFCLAPTDPIRLTVKNAQWQPDSVGLETSCPSDQSIWLRETLPVGWGDTYWQAKAGQSFNVTGVPNGTYLLRVWTNPRHRIVERTRDDDMAFLKIRLGGTTGARTVKSLGPVTPH